ncbi:MAG: peptidoglycan-binding protein [Chromatiaceae bacterium]|nr:peptidoglycan-binding protein [Chromatiaceae bacterium]
MVKFGTPLIPQPGYLGVSALAAILAICSAAAGGAPLTPALYTGNGGVPGVTLASYRTLSASLSRGYDRSRDISPRQLLTLLEVAERTGTSLGQALATGEMESAHTWNDHVRPPLANGQLGSATGVWQFLPATFQTIIKKYGAQLLAATAADSAANRAPLDLGEGPFTDAQVRDLIQQTVAGQRGAGDEELQLMRHNFAVLAFAKHYLSLDSGATTPEEDYLFHFLGEGQGRRILALARGEARDTLCVQMWDTPAAPPDHRPEPPGGAALVANQEVRKAPSPPPSPERVSVQAAGASYFLTDGPMPASARSPLPTEPALPSPTMPTPADNPISRLVVKLRSAAGIPVRALPAVVEEAVWVLPPAEPPPPPPLAEWGLPATSPTVTSNPGMFYRNGKGGTQPYTWAEFLDHLARQVRAQDQPALVRAKYGVGFDLKGGDMPQWTFDPKAATDGTNRSQTEFWHEISQVLSVPEALITGPLNREETHHYKRRLAELVVQGEDKPLNTLPAEALSGLQHLKLLPPRFQPVGPGDPEVHKALRAFRTLIGKAEPDDPAHARLLLPAERVALEIYDQRLARHAAWQAGQQASAAHAPDLNRIRKMPTSLKKRAAPHLATLQTALAGEGLLTPPTRKVVWRDKKRKKHIEYKRVPFAGTADSATVIALNSFQWRRGLRQTEGVLDAVTLNMLGLTAMGPEIFQPLSGPQCPINEAVEPLPLCEIEVPANSKAANYSLPISRPVSSNSGLLLSALRGNGICPAGQLPTPNSL